MYVAPNLTGYVGWPDGWSDLSLCWPCLCAWLCLWFLKLKTDCGGHILACMRLLQKLVAFRCTDMSALRPSYFTVCLHFRNEWATLTELFLISQCWNSPSIHVTFFTVTPYSVIQITNQDFIRAIQHIVAFSKYSQPRLFADVIPSFSTGGRFSNVCFYEKVCMSLIIVYYHQNKHKESISCNKNNCWVSQEKPVYMNILKWHIKAHHQDWLV